MTQPWRWRSVEANHVPRHERPRRLGLKLAVDTAGKLFNRTADWWELDYYVCAQGEAHPCHDIDDVVVRQIHDREPDGSTPG